LKSSPYIYGPILTTALISILSSFAVHDPIQGRSDFVSYFEKKRERLPPSDTPFILEGNPDDKLPKTRQQLQSMIKQPAWIGHNLLPERTIKVKQRQDNAHFAAMVASMDESLGRIVAKLRKLKLDQNTILIFVSDNGGMAAANFGFIWDYRGFDRFLQ
jgi:arylsulfatase A-like enzyme